MGEHRDLPELRYHDCGWHPRPLFPFSDPASTSGHLFPAYGLRKAGLDPDKDIKAIYAGSHTAAFEALYNKKVDAGELNSAQLKSPGSAAITTTATWCSCGSPTLFRLIRLRCAAIFLTVSKRRLVEVLAKSRSLSSLDEKDRKVIIGGRDGCHKQTKLMMEFAIW